MSCSEFQCSAPATNLLRIQALQQKYCNLHYQVKKNNLITTRLASNPDLSQSITDFKNIVRETASKIILESSMSIKAIQLKTQSDLKLLDTLQEVVKDTVAFNNGEKLMILEKFRENCMNHAFFENHFQELQSKVLKFNVNLEKIMNQKQDFSAGVLTPLIKIPEKPFDKFTQSKSLPNPRLGTSRYMIETRNGNKVIPQFIAAQIDRAREQGLQFVKIMNGERITNHVDLVNWKSYKINSNNEQETYYYRIFPQFQ